jgi:hypothetical protein
VDEEESYSDEEDQDPLSTDEEADTRSSTREDDGWYTGFQDLTWLMTGFSGKSTATEENAGPLASGRPIFLE